ncbi:MAG: hypothetical protein ACOX7H_00795 [Bacillota bacterium]|jgi:peroxiredoxin family protein
MTDKRIGSSSSSWEFFQRDQMQQNNITEEASCINITDPDPQQIASQPKEIGTDVVVNPSPADKKEKGTTKKARRKNSIINIDEKTHKIMRLSIIIFIIAIAGSCIGLYLKFSADKAFVQQELNRIAHSNQEALTDINTRLGTIEEQMNSISLILEEADKSISSSSSANREAMAKRIEELDKQLASLKNALELLKESKGNLR